MQIKNLFTMTGIMVTLTLGVTIIFLVIVLSSFMSRNEPMIPGSTVKREIPTPTPNKFLTAQEKKYPQATPQAYITTDNAYTSMVNDIETGSLVVTANIDKAWVTIDQREEAFAEGRPYPSKPSIEPAPTQYTPFIIQKIPVGIHSLTISKPNYIAQDFQIQIEKGKVTRLNVTLKPVR